MNILQSIQTPAYVADRQKISDNLAIAARIKQETGCTMLLATKAFSMFSLFDEFAKVLDGTTASGLYEARLGHEHFGGEVHAYSPAYSEAELEALLPICDHLYFNSVGQLEGHFSRWERSQSAQRDAGEGQKPVDSVKEYLESSPAPLTPQHLNTSSHPHPENAPHFSTSPTGRGIKLGIRLNPELSLVKNSSLYDPSAPNSRFGVKRHELTPELLDKIDILHVHNLCENMAEDSVALIHHLMQTVPHVLDAVEYVNLGGGHYFTHPDYKVEKLIDAINRLKATHKVKVILEPGGTLIYDAGYLVTSVMDVIEQVEPKTQGQQAEPFSGEALGSCESVATIGVPEINMARHQAGQTFEEQSKIAILDTSATCHMPDVLEVPYTPEVISAEVVTDNSRKHEARSEDRAPLVGEAVRPIARAAGECGGNYILTGKTCLTGDVIGEYQFSKPLKVGDRVIFKDMMQYTMVKNTTFNGMPLPDIGILEADGSYTLVKRFGYEDFKDRLS